MGGADVATGVTSLSLTWSKFQTAVGALDAAIGVGGNDKAQMANHAMLVLSVASNVTIRLLQIWRCGGWTLPLANSKKACFGGQHIHIHHISSCGVDSACAGELHGHPRSTS